MSRSSSADNGLLLIRCSVSVGSWSKVSIAWKLYLSSACKSNWCANPVNRSFGVLHNKRCCGSVRHADALHGSLYHWPGTHPRLSVWSCHGGIAPAALLADGNYLPRHEDHRGIILSRSSASQFYYIAPTALLDSAESGSDHTPQRRSWGVCGGCPATRSSKGVRQQPKYSPSTTDSVAQHSTTTTTPSLVVFVTAPSLRPSYFLFLRCSFSPNFPHSIWHRPGNWLLSGCAV